MKKATSTLSIEISEVKITEPNEYSTDSAFQALGGFGFA
jgi:hypothetical protein